MNESFGAYKDCLDWTAEIIKNFTWNYSKFVCQLSNFLKNLFLFYNFSGIKTNVNCDKRRVFDSNALVLLFS